MAEIKNKYSKTTKTKVVEIKYKRKKGTTNTPNYLSNCPVCGQQIKKNK